MNVVQLLRIAVVAASVLSLQPSVSWGASLVYDDNSGYDRFNPGPWALPSSSPPMYTLRDNISANGDNWLAVNGMHFLKAPYGSGDGQTGAPGYVGLYRGSTGDLARMNYTFTAERAADTLDWIAKSTIVRVGFERASRLRIRVTTDRSAEQIKEFTPWFATSDIAPLDPEAIDVGSTGIGWGIDGPEVLMSTDVSLLDIQPGDSVTLEFEIMRTERFPPYLYGSRSDDLGIGVMLVPEPASLALLAIGGICVWRRRDLARD